MSHKNFRDLTGQKFNMLTAIKVIGSDNGAVWLFKCECGNFCKNKGSIISNGHIQSCGCLGVKNQIKPKEIRSGERFFDFTVLSRSHKEGHNWQYLCACDCGKEFYALGSNIRTGNTKSCGCRRKSLDGLSNTGAHQSWSGMISRCYNEKVSSYKDYGMKGIRVCERWKDYRNFLSDMGDRPEGMTIERVDFRADYSPDNCKWATRVEQANNKSNNVFLEYHGESRTIAEWSRHLGISYSKIYSMYRKGYTMSEIVKCVQI